MRAFSRCVPLLFLLSSPIARAQFAEVTRYDVEQGLPQSMVNHVVQDRDGFIWLGTGDGLARFDGTRFVEFKHDPHDAASLANNRIWGIAADDHDGIRTGTSTGMDRLDAATGAFAHVGFGKSTDICWMALGTDNERSLWYSPVAHDFLLLDGSTQQRWPTQHHDSYCLRATVDLHRVQYFLSPDSLMELDLRTGEERVVLLPLTKSGTVCAFITQGAGCMILTTTGGWLFDPRSGARSPLPDALRAALEHAPGTKHVERAPDGSLWIGLDDQGVLVLDSTLAIKSFYPLLPESDRPLRITTIAFDHNGDTWVGTDGKGVFKIAPQRIKFGRCMPGIGMDRTVPSPFVRRFAQWDDHRVMVTFFEGGAALFDERSLRLAPLDLSGVFGRAMMKATIDELVNDPLGNVWILVANELVSLDPRTMHVRFRKSLMTGSGLTVDAQGFPVPLDLSPFRSLRDADGTINEHALDLPALNDHINVLRNAPHHVAFDEQGNTWVSPVHQPISVWGHAGRRSFARSTNAPLLEDVRMTGFFAIGKDSAWMTTNDGLYLWRLHDRAVLRHFTIHDGLPDQYLYSILPAGDGSWWISSNKGLSHYDPAHATFRNYSTADGLQSKEFNSGAAFRSSSGRLYFGGINGFNHFLPGDPRDDPDPPRVRIVSVIAQDHAVLLSTGKSAPLIDLPFPKNRLDLELAVLEFTAPEGNTFRYRMRGYQDEWRTSSPDRPIILERMPAGSFTLDVQGINSDGVVGPVSELLRVAVPLPFWASPWAFVLGGVLLAGIIALIVFAAYRRRVKARMLVAEMEMKDLRMRTRLAKEIHDDVGSGLARIAAVSRSGKRVEQAEERFEKVSDISGELLGNLRDVVWMNDPRNGELGALLLRIKDHAFDLFEGSSTEVRAQLPDPLPQRAISGSFQRNTYLIAKEALHNAKKYSRAKTVVVSCAMDNDRFVLEVKDDGGGMSTETLGSGNGMRNMRTGAADIGAQFAVSSDGESGTTIRLECPTSCFDA